MWPGSVTLLSIFGCHYVSRNAVVVIISLSCSQTFFRSLTDFFNGRKILSQFGQKMSENEEMTKFFIYFGEMTGMSQRKKTKKQSQTQTQYKSTNATC